MAWKLYARIERFQPEAQGMNWSGKGWTYNVACDGDRCRVEEKAQTTRTDGVVIPEAIDFVREGGGGGCS